MILVSSDYVSTSALYTCDPYLAHHGIKGQRWGVRRYMNEDGTLTEEGRRRYLVGEARRNLKEAKKVYNKDNKEYLRSIKYGLVAYDPRMYKKGSEVQKKYAKAVGKQARSVSKYKGAQNEYRYAKEDLKNSQIMSKINREKKISKHRQKLEQHYLEKGMTQDEARVAAYKRARTEKIMAIAGGVAVASIAAYGIHKYRQYAVDELLPKDLELGRISAKDADGVRDGMFAYIKKNEMDVNKYKGFYADQLRNGVYVHTSYGSDIYEKTMRAASNVKVASPKNAAKVFQSVLDRQMSSGDSSMRDAIRSSIEDTFGRYSKEYRQFSTDGKITPKIYDAINRELGAQSGRDAFRNAIDALKKSGYSAIADRNDMSYSGFAAKKPLILLDSSAFTVDSIKKVPISEINDRAKSAKVNMILNQIGKTYMTQQLPIDLTYAGIIGGGVAGRKISTSKRNDAIVAKYRKEHPNTTMSYTDIIRSYERRKTGG